jgi:hypothetical protein
MAVQLGRRWIDGGASSDERSPPLVWRSERGMGPVQRLSMSRWAQMVAGCGCPQGGALGSCGGDSGTSMTLRGVRHLRWCAARRGQRCSMATTTTFGAATAQVDDGIGA